MPVVPNISTNRSSLSVSQVNAATGNRPSVRRLAFSIGFAAVGLAPITTLALAILEIVPLHIGAPIFLGGAALLALGLWTLVPEEGRTVLIGLCAGLVAVTIYDCTRMPFVILGNWPDFIPKIGAWLVNEPEAHWSLGYLWRYLGNGAGMGLTFAMIVPYTDRWIGRQRAGPIYGSAVWTGLMLVVLVSPNGQGKLFVLTPITLLVSLIGHLVYGAILGLILQRQVSP